MPASSIRSTLSRQWELLKSLPARPPGVTAQLLAKRLDEAGFRVSKRTIERDLVELSQLFPLQCNDKGTLWLVLDAWCDGRAARPDRK